MRFGLRVAAERGEGETEAHLAEGVFAVGLMGAGEQGDGVGVSVLLIREDSGKVETVKKFGRGGADLAVKFFRLFEPAGLMVGERGLQRALELRGVHGAGAKSGAREIHRGKFRRAA